MSNEQNRDGHDNSPEKPIPPVTPDGKKAKTAKANGAGMPPPEAEAKKTNGERDNELAPEVEAGPSNEEAPPADAAAKPAAEAKKPDLKLVQGGAPKTFSTTSRACAKSPNSRFSGAS